MHRATLQVMKGRVALARGGPRAAAEAMSSAAELLRGAPPEDQHQLPFGALEIAARLAAAGPAAAIETAAKVIEGYEPTGGSPRYAWPLVVEAAGACIEAARQAGVGDERLRDETAAVAERLRTIAEKLETSGRARRPAGGPAPRPTRTSRACSPVFPGRHAGGSAGGRSGARLGAQAAELVSAWDGAAAVWAALSEPYPLAQSLLRAAEIAVACGDRDGAAESLQRAAGAGRRAGRGAARRTGRDPGPAGQIPVAGGDGGPAQGGSAHGAGPRGAGLGLGLTERELEVLRLVAAGRSNREIAAELFISPKTASVHVSNILGKLGAASRGEAAAKAHTLRLFEPA